MSINERGDVSVLHIITRLDRGGSADMLLSLASSLSCKGWSVGIAVGRTDDPSLDIDRFASGAGIKIIHIPHLVRNVAPFSDLMALFETVRAIRRFKPDIVHTHTSKAGIIGRLAAFVTGCRAVVHTPHGHIFYGYYGRLVTSVFILMERLAANVTRKITVLTEGGKTDHIRCGIGRESLYTVIPSGVDIQRFKNGDSGKLRAELSCGNRPLVGWVGRLTAIKDCPTFLNAAACIAKSVGDAYFVVVGDGEDHDSLTLLRDSLGLRDSLVFLGNRNDIPDIMAALDVFVLSSVNEGFGRVLVEAMAASAAVVSTRVGGTPDIIDHGENGFLVPPSDPDAICSVVTGLLTDEPLRMRIAGNARGSVDRFSVESVVTQFEDVYEALFD